VKFCQFVARLYIHERTNFGQFILILNKMTLFFRSTYRFYCFKFRVSQVRLPWLDR